MGGVLAGSSLLELAFHRAAWARAAAPGAESLFHIQKVADGIYFAQARPQAMLNCNAAIFVRSADVVVVDTHSKPSAVASLISQMQREVTTRPVRYVINTHFHWDHTQGSQAYRSGAGPVDFIASSTTKQLMSNLSVARAKASAAEVPKLIDALQAQAANAGSAGEKAFCADQIRQLKAYQEELKNYAPELPTITFEKTYLLRDPAFDLHLEFHGHAHTAGDIVVYCPQKQVVATGDVIHGFLPFIADGFPRVWPGTIDSIGQADFHTILPGHAALQTGRIPMTSLRNYIEELSGKVADGKQAGLSLSEMQQRYTVASLKSLHSNGYLAYLARMSALSHSRYEKTPALQAGVNVNISEIFTNLDRT